MSAFSMASSRGVSTTAATQMLRIGSTFIPWADTFLKHSSPVSTASEIGDRLAARLQDSPDEVRMSRSHENDNNDELPPGQPVIGNDSVAEPGDEEPLDKAPVPTLTEPGDTNGG